MHLHHACMSTELELQGHTQAAVRPCMHAISPKGKGKVIINKRRLMLDSVCEHWRAAAQVNVKMM